MKKNTTKHKPVVTGKTGQTAEDRFTEKRLMVSIIADDLVNYRLVMGLYELGLVTELYFLNASQTVFEFMGIKTQMDDDRHYERYENLKARVMKINLEEGRNKLNALAEKIYTELIAIKQLQKD